jgi:hypothetical protein
MSKNQFDPALSGEQLLENATRRLNDEVPKEERAIKENSEAASLFELITKGRKNIQCYEFLRRYWERYIANTPGLSMFTYPGVTAPLPIVKVELDHIFESAPAGKKLINSLLEVETQPRFRDYSKTEPEIDEGSKQGRAEELMIRSPLARYLTRYKGPTQANVGFRDDYTGHNVCLSGLNFGSDGKLMLPLKCSTELYGNIMDSSDALIYELYLHFARSHYKELPSPDQILSELPWRSQLHAQAENPVDVLTKVNGRAAGIGVAALTVFKEGGKYVAYRATRSKKVGTYASTYHVIPSGMTNIDLEDKKANDYLLRDKLFNIELAIEREFLEEIFNQEFAVGLGSSKKVGGVWPSFVQGACKSYLYGLDDEYGAEIHLTGIVFDLLNYRPEICVLILIRDEKWWENHNPTTGNKKIRFSFEWNKNDEVNRVDIFDRKALVSMMPPNESVLSGVASFYLGVEKARALLGD